MSSAKNSLRSPHKKLGVAIRTHMGGAGCPVLPAGRTEPPQIVSESRISGIFCASLSTSHNHAKLLCPERSVLIAANETVDSRELSVEMLACTAKLN
jgi:hypothetical protein